MRRLLVLGLLPLAILGCDGSQAQNALKVDGQQVTQHRQLILSVPTAHPYFPSK
jgi:uncharacterized protein YcfL